jgi:hypothetical protein
MTEHLDIVIDDDVEPTDLRPLARLLLELARARRQREVADAGQSKPLPENPNQCSPE